MKPQFSGWKFQKIFELPPPRKWILEPFPKNPKSTPWEGQCMFITFPFEFEMIWWFVFFCDNCDQRSGNKREGVVKTSCFHTLLNLAKKLCTADVWACRSLPHCDNMCISIYIYSFIYINIIYIYIKYYTSQVCHASTYAYQCYSAWTIVHHLQSTRRKCAVPQLFTRE